MSTQDMLGGSNEFKALPPRGNVALTLPRDQPLPYPATMSLRVAPLALFAALLLQNLAEAWSGGPAVPEAFAALLPARQNPRAALILITFVLAGLILPASVRPSRRTDTADALAAGGLALNAVLQALGSLALARMLPGTLVGLLAMLPAAIAVLWLQGRPALLPALLGMVLSPALLLATSHLAALLP